MVKVCCKWFPKGTREYQKSDGFSMHPILKAQLDILLKNIKNDWDFTIIITGGGEVRVGKSVLAMQIGAYRLTNSHFSTTSYYNCKVPIILYVL